MLGFRPQGHEGHAASGDHAVIGNERTATRVVVDGAIDPLPLPAFQAHSHLALITAAATPAAGGTAAADA